MDDTTPFLKFDCEYGETIIVERAAAVAGTAGVMNTHGIPAAMSRDLAQQLQRPWPPAGADAAGTGGRDAAGQQQEQQPAAVPAAAA